MRSTELPFHTTPNHGWREAPVVDNVVASGTAGSSHSRLHYVVCTDYRWWNKEAILPPVGRERNPGAPAVRTYCTHGPLVRNVAIQCTMYNVINAPIRTGNRSSAPSQGHPWTHPVTCHCFRIALISQASISSYMYICSPCASASFFYKIIPFLDTRTGAPEYDMNMQCSPTLFMFTPLGASNWQVRSSRKECAFRHFYLCNP